MVLSPSILLVTKSIHPTHKWLRSKSSNAILTLKCPLSISDIDGEKQLLEMIHGLCQFRDNLVGMQC